MRNIDRQISIDMHNSLDELILGNYLHTNEQLNKIAENEQLILSGVVGSTARAKKE